MSKIIGGGLMALGVYGILSALFTGYAPPNTFEGAGACIIFGAFIYHYW